MDNQTIFNIILSALVVILIIFIVVSSGKYNYCAEWKLTEGTITRNNLDAISGPIKDIKNNTYVFNVNYTDNILHEVVYDPNYQIIKNDSINCNLYLKTK